MSFFGGTNTLGASSTPAKSTGLFSSFNTAPTATAAPAFGTTTSTAAPAFGATQAPTFGQAAANTVPTFGAAAPTSAPAFGTAPTFGAATTNIPTLGGFTGFGTGTATSTPSMFGGTAAAPIVSAPGTFGGFGTAAPTSAPNTGFGGFGTNVTSSAAPTFGGFGGTQTSAFGGVSAFGGNQQSAFGTSFAKPATTTVTPGFGGFGGNTSFMLGQPQQTAPQITPDEAFAQSILNVAIFGDERDTIIAKWNYLQAMWGTGKLFYSQSAAPVDITPENYLCRFKAMGYSRLPGKDNKMGLVALNISKPLSEVTAQQQQIIQTLHTLFGSKPNFLVHIDSSKDIEEKKCQIVIYVEERSQLTPNESKRILATDVANYLSQANIKAQLNNLGIVEALALVLPDEDQLKEYLENPPKGVDPRMWRQAKSDNPDSTKFIPVPMIGFHDLKWRVKCQEQENETHNLYLRKVEKDLEELRRRHAATTSKILEHKRKLAELCHLILKIIVKQECTRKVGLALTPEEESLRTKLENMQAVLSAPTQFKGRLSELLSQMRMQRNQFAQNGGSEYTLNKESEDEMKTFLAMQQKAMEVLTDTVTKDLKSLDIILQGLPELQHAT